MRDIEAEAIKLGTQRELLEKLTTDTVTLKKHLLNEKRRTASVYMSLADAVAAQQGAEASVITLRQSVRSLQTTNRKLEKGKLDGQIAIQKLSMNLSNCKKRVASAAASNGKEKPHGNKSSSQVAASAASAPAAPPPPPAPPPAPPAADGAAADGVAADGAAARAPALSAAAVDSLKRDREGDADDGALPANKRARPPFDFNAASAAPAASVAAAAAGAGAATASSSSSSAATATAAEATAGGTGIRRNGHHTPSLPSSAAHNGSLASMATYVGRAVRKNFDGKYFDGHVVSHRMGKKPKVVYFKVLYEDEDWEELELKELEQILMQKGVRPAGKGT